MTEQTQTHLTPYQRQHQRIVAAVQAWIEDPPPEQDAGSRAQWLVDCLDDEGLQILPRCPSTSRWRVVVDGDPAPSPFNADRPSGPLDADETAAAFLTAATDADDAAQPREITIRPATDRELVAGLLGDRALHAPAVTVTPNTWAIVVDEQAPDVRLLSATDGTTTVVLRPDADMVSLLGNALSDESEER